MGWKNVKQFRKLVTKVSMATDLLKKRISVLYDGSTSGRFFHDLSERQRLRPLPSPRARVNYWTLFWCVNFSLLPSVPSSSPPSLPFHSPLVFIYALYFYFYFIFLHPIIVAILSRGRHFNIRFASIFLLTHFSCHFAFLSVTHWLSVFPFSFAFHLSRPLTYYLHSERPRARRPQLLQRLQIFKKPVDTDGTALRGFFLQPARKNEKVKR